MSRLVPYLDPYAQPIAAHPLFRVETRRTHWGRAPSQFRRRGLVTIALWAVITSIVWAVFGLGLEQASTGDPFRYGYIRAQDVWLLMLMLSLLGGGVLDFISLFTSVSAISHEITSGRWDLLRLTALNDQGLVAAKQAAAQVRVWPRLMAFVGMRLALIVVGFLLLLRSFNLDVSREQVLNSLFTSLALIVLALIYLAEPFWRVQAMTALGILMSVRERHAATSLLWSGFSLLAIWLLQALVVGTVAIAVVLLLVVSFSLLEGGGAHLLAVCYDSVMLAVFLSAIYGYNHLLERWSMRRALTRIARLN